MDQRGAPEFILEAFADPNSVRDVVRGELETPDLIPLLPPLILMPPLRRDPSSIHHPPPGRNRTC